MKVRIGRLSDFSDALLAEHPTLPVIRGDMPDTWIHGPMSDPAGQGWRVSDAARVVDRGVVADPPAPLGRGSPVARRRGGSVPSSKACCMANTPGAGASIGFADTVMPAGFLMATSGGQGGGNPRSSGWRVRGRNTPTISGAPRDGVAIGCKRVWTSWRDRWRWREVAWWCSIRCLGLGMVKWPWPRTALNRFADCARSRVEGAESGTGRREGGASAFRGTVGAGDGISHLPSGGAGSGFAWVAGEVRSRDRGSWRTRVFAWFLTRHRGLFVR